MPGLSAKYGRLTLYSLFLNVFLILFFIGKRTYYYFSGSISDTDKAYADILNRGRAETLNALPMDSADIVFLGDSQTEKFPINEMFPNPRVKNRGVGQNTTAHILGRAAPIIAAHPAKVFLQMGLNDIAENISIDSIIINYDRLITLFRNGSAHTKIYIESACPLAGIASNARLIKEVERLNSRLKVFCLQKKLSYIDLYPLMYKDDGLNPSLSWDGAHLNYEGYSIWKKAIDSLVR